MRVVWRRHRWDGALGAGQVAHENERCTAVGLVLRVPSGEVWSSFSDTWINPACPAQAE
jgi:hypothetical protein